MLMHLEASTSLLGTAVHTQGSRDYILAQYISIGLQAHLRHHQHAISFIMWHCLLPDVGLPFPPEGSKTPENLSPPLRDTRRRLPSEAFLPAFYDPQRRRPIF